MKIEALAPFNGEVKLIRGDIFKDDRGWFTEVWNEKRDGLPPFVQLNQSLSKRGVLRGMHFQAEPRAQGKLVWVVTGSLFDVVVDIRRGSPTYGRYGSIVLNDEDGVRLWVPAGFAHGFQAIRQDTRMCYLVTDVWSKEHEHTLTYRDPCLLGVRWPHSIPTLSVKDAAGKTLRELEAMGVLPTYAPRSPSGTSGTSG